MILRRSRSRSPRCCCGNEHARHLGTCERAGDRLGVRGSYDDGRPAGVRLAEALLVAHVVEDERLLERDLVLALDRDLGHLAARGPEPALPHQTVTVPPGSGREDLAVGGQALAKLFGRPGQERERPVVARDAAVDAEEFERDGRLARIHREVAADRQDRDVGRVEARDQLHVAEDARVAGEVQLRPVLDLDHEARRLAEGHDAPIVEDAARVPGVDERDLDAGGLERPALVARLRVVLGEASDREPVANLDERDHRALEALCQLEGVAEVVAVPVREGDQVDALRRLLALGALRVAAEPGVDVDALAPGRVDPESRMSEPRNRSVCHVLSLPR